MRGLTVYTDGGGRTVRQRGFSFGELSGRRLVLPHSVAGGELLQSLPCQRVRRNQAVRPSKRAGSSSGRFEGSDAAERPAAHVEQAAFSKGGEDRCQQRAALLQLLQQRRVRSAVKLLDVRRQRVGAEARVFGHSLRHRSVHSCELSRRAALEARAGGGVGVEVLMQRLLMPTCVRHGCAHPRRGRGHGRASLVESNDRRCARHARVRTFDSQLTKPATSSPCLRAQRAAGQDARRDPAAASSAHRRRRASARVPARLCGDVQGGCSCSPGAAQLWLCDRLCVPLVGAQ